MTNDRFKNVAVSGEITEATVDMHEACIESDGEFSGWHIFRDVPFNLHIGPFYHRPSPRGVLCAFRPSIKSGNGIGAVHGGTLMAFADFSMFAAAQFHYRSKHLVTVTLSSEFLGVVRPADYVEAQAEVVSASGSLIVVRGIMTAEKRPVLNYSGTFKRLRAM